MGGGERPSSTNSKLYSMNRTPPQGPTGPAGSDAAGPQGEVVFTADPQEGRASPASSNTSLFTDPAVLGVVKTPKSKSGGPSGAGAGAQGPSTGAIPKTRAPKPAENLDQTTNLAPSGSQAQGGPVPSFMIETSKTGPLDLYGKSEAIHAKYLNSFKTSVNKAEQHFARELCHGNVSVAELKDFCK